MRLLNVKTKQFEEFLESDIPLYCILSHRWGKGEVSFKEFRKGSALDSPGYRKIIDFCAVVERETVPYFGRGFYGSWSHKSIEWVWIDTCCIDKRSSAELSEAINSMYSWYEDSAVCYAYLADVEHETLATMSVDDHWGSIAYSAWFTRGWTLQELLAPKLVVFVDAQWNVLGHKCQCPIKGTSLTEAACKQNKYGPNLNAALSKITPIPFRQLQRFSPHSPETSVAQRMSWAAKRATSRVEDQAYCLMGLFSINMPLIYGEKDGAFTRLQEEIIKRSTDLSIFAWMNQILPRQLFAKSPKDFARSGRILKSVSPSRLARGITVTSEGITMTASLFMVRNDSCDPDEPSQYVQAYCLPLDCRREDIEQALFLERIGDSLYCVPASQRIRPQPSDPEWERLPPQQITIVKEDLVMSPSEVVLSPSEVLMSPSEIVSPPRETVMSASEASQPKGTYR